LIDVIAICVVLGFTLAGFLSGILRTSLWVVALLVAYFASVRVTAPFAHLAGAVASLPAGTAHVLGRVAAGIAIYVSLVVFARIADRKVGRFNSGVLKRWNRNGGALAGLVFGTLLVFCGLCVADALLKASPESEAFFARKARASRLRALVSPINPADRFLITDFLRLLSAVKQDPVLLEKLKEQEEYRVFLENPKVKAVLEDEQLMEAIRAGNWSEVLAHERTRALLKDEELRKTIFSVRPPPEEQGE